MVLLVDSFSGTIEINFYRFPLCIYLRSGLKSVNILELKGTRNGEKLIPKDIPFVRYKFTHLKTDIETGKLKVGCLIIFLHYVLHKGLSINP